MHLRIAAELSDNAPRKTSRGNMAIEGRKPLDWSEYSIAKSALAARIYFAIWRYSTIGSFITTFLLVNLTDPGFSPPPQIPPQKGELRGALRLRRKCDSKVLLASVQHTQPAIWQHALV